MKHFIILDVETTGNGFDINHEILQISAIFYHKGISQGTFNRKYKPSKDIEYRNGINQRLGEDYAKLDLEDNYSGFNEFVEWLTKMQTKFDKYSTEKFYMVAYNADWDYRHLKNWFKKNDDFIWKYFHRPPICVMQLAIQRFGYIPKLEDCAQKLGIPINPKKLHDARYDTYITEQIYFKFLQKIRS